MCEDLRTTLRIEGCEFFRSSVNRPNLYYEVAHKPAVAADAVAAMVAWVQAHYPDGESGIVYCLTRCARTGQAGGTACLGAAVVAAMLCSKGHIVHA